MTITLNDRNPREITEKRLTELQESIIRFGDLSGIVLNRRTGNLIGGHQRRKALQITEASITITRQAPGIATLDQQGTVQEGYAEIHGEKFAYREVDWEPGKELAAMVAANAHGGTWDKEMLKELVNDLSSSDLLGITGMSAKEIDDLTKDGQLMLTGGKPAGEPPSIESEQPPTGAHIKLIQLFLNSDNIDDVKGMISRIGTVKGLADAAKVVDYCVQAEFRGIGAKKGSANE